MNCLSPYRLDGQSHRLKNVCVITGLKLAALCLHVLLYNFKVFHIVTGITESNDAILTVLQPKDVASLITSLPLQHYLINLTPFLLK